MNSKRLVILLIGLLVVPLAVLAWFAKSAVTEQQAQVRNQFIALLQDRVDQKNAGIETTLRGVQNDLRQSLDGVENPIQMSELIRTQGITLCGFWLDSQGRLLFPDSTQALSAEESAFLVRTRGLWSAKAKLDASGDAEMPALGTRSSHVSNSEGSSLLSIAQSREEGWIPWFWEDGLHLLYWHRGSDGSVQGYEVDRIALLSWIIGALPEKDPGMGAFVLQDERGIVLHRFGGYQIPAGSRAIVERSLPAPLQGWKLAYHGPVAEWESKFVRNERFSLLWKLGMVGVLLVLVAMWFWRESTRSLREARQRVDFVNQVSHELKTPLTNIRLYAELLEDELEESEHRDKLRVIQSESERLSRMILNILTFSRQERRKLNLSMQPIDLADVAAEVSRHFALSMEKRGLHIELSGTSPRYIPLDRDAAKQIIANLLSNAEKYAALGKRVEVEIIQDAQWTELRVHDHGPGIPQNLQHKVFEPFYRVSDRLTEGVSGTGIGLSIARTLAEMQNGTLALQPSKSGACFIWRINA